MRRAVLPLRSFTAGSPLKWRVRSGLLGLAILTCLQPCYAQQPWPLWQHYRAYFLESSGRIVDHTDHDRTTSEGQAYGMFFALAANDRQSFNAMLRWTQDNLAAGDLKARLPSWEWGKGKNGQWRTLDTNSAADADLWLAYDCLEGGRLWKDDRLTNLGDVLADRIVREEVTSIAGVGAVLLPAPHGFRTAKSGYFLNLSYSPPQLLARFRQKQPSGPWGAMALALPTLFTAGAPAGWAMDWMQVGDLKPPLPSPSPEVLSSAGKEVVPVGSYEAIRVYLWLGLANSHTSGVQAGLAALPAMARYLHSHPSPPRTVSSSGTVLHADAPVGFSAAVLPYLQVTGHESQARAQMDRLDASLQPDLGLYGREVSYYDQNLALFATGWAERRFRFDRDGRLEVNWKV